jgi:hypothetical protein
MTAKCRNVAPLNSAVRGGASRSTMPRAEPVRDATRRRGEGQTKEGDAPSPMAYLAIYQIGRDEACCRHELTKAATVGRALDCELPFGTDDGLSRRHCTVEPTDASKKSWAVVDLKSSNGTRVGATYVDRQVLRDGDEIYAGRLRIVFHAVGYVPKRPEQPDARFAGVGGTAGSGRGRHTVGRATPVAASAGNGRSDP